MCGFHIRYEIPLKVIFDHRIIAWGMTCISHQIQDLVRGIHQHMLVSGSGPFREVFVSIPTKYSSVPFLICYDTCLRKASEDG